LVQEDIDKEKLDKAKFMEHIEEVVKVKEKYL